MAKKMIVIFILLLSNLAFSQEKQLICQESSCSTNFVPVSQVDKTLFTSVMVGTQNNQDISVTVPSGAKPRSIRVYVEQNDTSFSRNLNFNLASSSSEFNAGDTMVIGDIFNNVTVNTDGYAGIDGKSSSQLCAETFKAGNSGFGEIAKGEFDFRRITDLTLPPNNCSFVDLQYLQDNNFSCGEPGFTEIDVNNPEVLVKRLKGKYRCIGLSYHNVCLSKSVAVECRWKIKYTDPPAVAGTYSTSANDEEVKYLTMSEYDYNLNINKPGFKDYICENLTRLQSEPAPVELIKNGELYVNLSSWNNEGALWDNAKERMKLSGGAGLDVKSKASQTVTTEAGAKYRFRATWAKDALESTVSSGQVNLYSDAAKSNRIHRENIYSLSSIKGVFLTSDDAPHHFGYVRRNSGSSVKNFSIINRDDRAARSCGNVYLSGPNSNEFLIVGDNCNSIDLNVGESCSVDIRAFPNTIGQKEARIRRDCSDEFGNSTSSLNEPVLATAYQDYTQTTVNGQPAGAYTDSFYWRLISGRWHRCSLDSATGKTCFLSAPVIATERCLDKGVYCPGYDPAGMIVPLPLPAASNDSFPILEHSSINANLRIENKSVDFIFTATSNTTVFELSTILKFHSGTFDGISLIKLSPNAGPSVKAPASKTCPNEGCVAGALGNGYYELYGTPTKTVTQPSHDSTYYTIPPESDWKIRYVPTNSACPTGFSLIKPNHLASNISYDENDDQCDDVYIPEDPTGKVISWKYVGFDRLPEFGTELILCKLGNCIVQSSIREGDRNLITYNPGSGSSGTQQGEGLLFVYDIKHILTSYKNGSGGQVGANDLTAFEQPKACARIQDAETTGLNSLYAKDPVVDFKKLRWKAIKVIESGNFGRNPPNNGKSIRVFKKMDSSIRYLLKQELM